MMKSALIVSAGVVFLAALLTSTPAAAQQTVCIQCHQGQPGHLGAPVDLWRGSIHAANGISCHGCHGGDPTDYAMAMSPERGFLGVPAEEETPDFCGRCHVGVREDYLDSAHGRALGSGGPQCVTCHGSHAIQRTTSELINPQDCSRCHEYGRAEEIKTAVTETDRMITVLDADLDGLHRVGIATRPLEDRLFDLRNRFHRVFHTVEVDRVRQVTGGIREELTQVRADVDDFERTLSRRKIYGGILIALLLAISAVAAMLRKSYRDDEKGREEGV